jgi:hypothetical protein
MLCYGNGKSCRLHPLANGRALSMLSGCHLSRPTTRVQIESASGMEARVKTADGGTVTVALAKPPAFQSDYVEFEGIVNTPTTFTEIDRATFGNKFGTSPNNIHYDFIPPRELARALLSAGWSTNICGTRRGYVQTLRKKYMDK